MESALKLLVFAVTFILLTCPAFANAFTLMVDEITDTRTTGDHFAGLKVKFNALGDDIIDAKAIKLTINEVLDDTGKSLITENTNNNDFICPEEKFSDIEIKLKNPKRKSTSLKILSGTLTIYNPQNDRYATAIITNFSNVNGKNIINESLKKSNVDICILSKQHTRSGNLRKKKILNKKQLPKE